MILHVLFHCPSVMYFFLLYNSCKNVKFVKTWVVALDISEKNCLSWMLDAEMHLNVVNLGKTIIKHNENFTWGQSNNLSSSSSWLKTKNEYLTVKDSYLLWRNFKRLLWLSKNNDTTKSSIWLDIFEITWF